MTLWVKICGLTTTEGVQAAVDAGADAIGFVFAPSKRQVTATQAAVLAAAAPSHLTRVAVMLHPAQSLVDEVIARFQPDVLQTDAEDFQALHLPGTLVQLPVFRAGKLPSSSALPARLMFEGPVSGTGVVADWTQAGDLARRTHLILAGGLAPTNVAAAIACVHPAGVDVSSGVEQSPGVKSVEKIHAFVQAARAAARESQSIARAAGTC